MKSFILFLSLLVFSYQSASACLSTLRVPAEIIDAGGFRSQKYLNSQVAQLAENIYKDINKNWRYRDVENNEKHSIESDEWSIIYVYWERIKNKVLTIQYTGNNFADDYLKALKKLPTTKAIIECTLGSQIVQILSLALLMEDDLFKKHLHIQDFLLDRDHF